MAEKNLIEQAFEDEQPPPEIVPVGDVSSSAETGKLLEAFVAMQGKLQGAEQTGWDPTHGQGRNYSNIDDVLNAIRVPMAAHGLAVMQFPVATGDGRLSMTSRIVHSSGQWLQTPALVATVVDFRGNPTANIQALGSAVTYLRRYQLKPLVGLSDEDDDGDSASGNGVPEKKAEANAGACPECGKALKLRAGKRGDFYGCSGYPACKYTRDASTSQPQPESPGTVVPSSEPVAVDEPERKKLREALKKAGNAAGMDDAALSVWIKGMGRNTATCSVEDINGLINLIPAISKQYKDWLALTDGMKDSGNIVNILNADATHFLQLRTDDREAALTQARLKAAKEVPY